MPTPSHLTRGNLGSRLRMSVLGRWKTTLYRGLRVFFHWLRLTALAATLALSLPAGRGGGSSSSEGVPGGRQSSFSMFGDRW